MLNIRKHSRLTKDCLDDVLVTKTGFVDLTTTPKSIDEVEALLA